jgi:hypothetical protein
MRRLKSRHTGAPAKESEETKGHIQMQLFQGELSGTLEEVLKSDKINFFKAEKLRRCF